ncbi:RNA polymerase sigma factor [Candidatus Solirubrobacter pratensis]|uniref:RNA polymerase sigma factor n=1 Tax=Candidatus Solirubrobacter pratensis TaxID=1298857 RepID=UPI00040E2C98|nr:RNA polymerase sigma factor [Candidatus Solirubrobacter pratensis]
MRSYADASDDALLGWTPGDPDAFGAFYRRHEDSVLRYMVARVRDGELAADLTAETFAAALISAPRFRPRPEPATAWLFGIARNVLRSSLERRRVDDRARRRLGMPPLELSDEDVSGIEALLADVTARQMLEGLPVDQAGAIQARFLEDASYEDIARRLSCSEAVVRKRVSRGLATLRARYKGSGA